MTKIITKYVAINILLFIFGLLQPTSGKPFIEGPSEVVAQIGRNIELKCYANKEITWVKFINSSTDRLENDFQIQFPSHPDFTDWPDDPPRHREENISAILYFVSIEEEDAGIYMCIYEDEVEEITYKQIMNNTKGVFSSVLVTVRVIKPVIDVGERVDISAGNDLNITCSGEHPVKWIFSNISSLVVHDWEDKTIGKYYSTLEIQDARNEDRGFVVCHFDNKDYGSAEEIPSSSTFLFIRGEKPLIDVIAPLTLLPGDSINITCSGRKPVTWVLLNNHTWGVQHTEDKEKSTYSSTLQIQNVNYTDVGYLVCKFTEVDVHIYDDFDEDDGSSSTYLFVKDRNHLLLPPETNEINAQMGTEAVVPCKPTFPDVRVELEALDDSKISHDEYDPTKGFTIKKISKKKHEGFWQCKGVFGSSESNFQLIHISVLYNPILSGVNLTMEGAWQTNVIKSQEIHVFDVIEGRKVRINCSTQHRRKLASIKWTLPSHFGKKSHHEIRHYDIPGHYTDSRIISNVSMETDTGVYSCYVTNHHRNSSAYVFVLNVFRQTSSHLELQVQNAKILLQKNIQYPPIVTWIIFFRAYPAMTLQWIKDGDTKIIYKIRTRIISQGTPMIRRREHYEIEVHWERGEIMLKIQNPSVVDTGTYLLLATVQEEKGTIKKNLTLSFYKEDAPQNVEIAIAPHAIPREGGNISIECSAYGYPFPTLKIFFKTCKTVRDCKNSGFVDIEAFQLNEERVGNSSGEVASGGKSSVRWRGVAHTRGIYGCTAFNRFGEGSAPPAPIYISHSEFDRPQILQIELKRNGESSVAKRSEMFIEGDNVEFICVSNSFRTSAPLLWTVNSPNRTTSVTTSPLSLVYNPLTLGSFNFTHNDSTTKLAHISVVQGKMTKKMNAIKLVCTESSVDRLNDSIIIAVQNAHAPIWASEPLNRTGFEKMENERLNRDCAAVGVPEPTVTWFKNGKKLVPEASAGRVTIDRGTLTIQFLFPQDSGKYLCRIENREGILEDYFTLKVLDPDAAPQFYLVVIIAVVSLLFLMLVLILAIKVYRDRKADRMFKLETQKRFIEGRPECLNPDLDLGEQADLLPYDNRFELPRDRVTIESLLGSGAFGNVFKATVLNLIPGQSKTTVAVKMLKSSANASQMKTLVSELKIMIHIGRHVNIVNVLGACSKNMASKGELLLIVEYCRYGNILDYMRKNRSKFTDQINERDKIDPNMAAYRERTHSNPRTPTRPSYGQLNHDRSSKRYSSEAGGHSTSEERKSSVDNYFGTYSSAGRTRLVSGGGLSNGTVNTDLSTATSDNYINEITLEQRGYLCSKDLLHWAYQIANGMFYLSEKKVIHGDLAARNILLADRNVVKISDFGLSKNIYKKEQYKKKSECPLPVKWVALEALQDSIFSTHSDVWSYGVVLWEIFSLGSNPYAGVEVDHSFVTKLDQGLRLKHPAYATSELYHIMMQCWAKNPNLRPSFRDLEATLGDMLGETEKQMYMTLNAHYEENNYISELVQFLHTPSYDSRMRGFFEKDEDGYQKPLVPDHPGIIMKSETDHLREKQDHGDIFELGPVPVRRKSNCTSSQVHSSPEERRSLLKKRDTNYLVMTSPTEGEMQPNFTVISRSSGENSSNNVTYANIVQMNGLNDSNPKSIFSPKEPPYNCTESSVNPTKDVPKIFTFNEVGTLSERDSVFGSVRFQDDLESVLKNQRLRKNSNQREYNFENKCYHKKHDSGMYSPNILQNNPTYTTMSFITSDNSFNNKDKAYEENHSHESDSVDRKYRNQSDSSSGCGSLVEELPNSLERCNNNKLKAQPKEHVKKYLETECL